MKDRFSDKVVLITGSSSGIGRGAALTFAAQGAKVVLASRSQDANQELLDEIKKNGGSAIFVKTDITKTEDIANMVKRTISEYGKLDIAVNNAGVEGTPDVKTADYDEQVWDQVIDINLKGVWLSMKYEIPELLKEGGGVIINISSLAGLQGGGAGIGYHASKFGVVGMTKATALEYAKDNLRVNAVCPAVIETPMAERAFDTDEKRNHAIDFHPVGRFGTVDEVVSTICWLASDEASFITGSAVAVDGGANL
ncbi:MAG: NAD(P)-dependent dehydrogenase (short-subunit alcohol dehydrogenase family) [Maribacter sp.]|jgi:NAD(P)-dependent dehydrogenase (short-subunit alcohol dehydrogenase family)